MNRYAQIVAQTQQQRRLFSAHWELTYRCNERCTHCYLDVRAPRAGIGDELTTVECYRVMDELATLGVLNLTLSGGEILVRADFFEIAEHARAQRFLLRLFTNGTLVTPHVADRIAALHPYAVEISLYSATAETHERITCQPRSFNLTQRAFHLLRERGVRTVLKTPLMRENVREFHALRVLADEWGARFRYGITITPKDSGDCAPLHHRLSDDDMQWLFQQALEPMSWREQTILPTQGTCNIGQNALVLGPDGMVYPCVQVRTPVGNVRMQSLKTIWEDASAWGEWRGLTLDTLPVCRTCELVHVCVRCHGLAWLEDGDVRAPATANCREARARNQMLIEQESASTNKQPRNVNEQNKFTRS